MAAGEAGGALEIRPLTAIADFEDAVRLQKQIWGFADIELLPRRLFVVATKIGGQAFGAFSHGEMVAFVLAIPGLKAGAKTYLHSHMLGVLPEYRNRGVGRLLKHYQREEALSRGIGLMEWTFDPLELKNAFFNIERLGAIVTRYVLNQYGTTSSHLHGGLPTDRCVAEWWLQSERVQQRLAGAPSGASTVEHRIAVPLEIDELRRQDPARARAIQAEVSQAFLGCFDQGLAVTGFARTATTGDYLLSRHRE